jgi:hypothetical protein
VAQTSFREALPAKKYYYYSLSPCAAQIQNQEIATTLIWCAQIDKFWIQSSYPNVIQVNLPVNLPPNAVGQSVVVYFVDEGNARNEVMDFFLTRHEMQTGNQNVMAFLSTKKLPALAARRKLEDTTISYSSIDNHKYSYSLQIQFWQGSSNLKFCGAKIKYTLPTT